MYLGSESFLGANFDVNLFFFVRKTHLSVRVHKVVLTDQVHLGEEELQWQHSHTLLQVLFSDVTLAFVSGKRIFLVRVHKIVLIPLFC